MTVLVLLLCGQPAAWAQEAGIFTQYDERQCFNAYNLLERVGEKRVVQCADSIEMLARQRKDIEFAFYARLYGAYWATRYVAHRPTGEWPMMHLKKDIEITPYPAAEAEYYLLLGQCFEDRGDHANAFHYRIMGAELAEKIGWNKLPVAVILAAALFEVYYHYEDYPSAIRFAKIALQKPEPNGIRRATYLYSNMGEAYLQLKQIEKAQQIFKYVVALAEKTNDSAYIGIGNGNYGNSLRLQGRYREALPYLYTELSVNEKRVPENAAISCAYIADCLLRLDSVEKAGHYLRRGYNLHINYYWSWAAFYTAYYNASALYYKKRGEYRLASLFQDSLQAVKDSLRERYSTSMFLTTSLTLKEQKHLARQEQKELEMAQLRFTRILFLSAACLVFVVVLGFLWARWRNAKQEILLRHQQAELKLNEYLELLQEKTRLVEVIEQRFKMQQEVLQPKIASVNEEPSFENMSIVTEEDWVQFKRLFEAAHPGWMETLHVRYPNLTPGDERILVLSKLGLSTKDSAAILGINPGSLRTNRYRLRKRFPNLSNDPELKDCL